MKTKYQVYAYSGTSNKEIKSFKNEPEAVAFVSADKNISQHGYMSLIRTSSSGERSVWNEQKEKWESE